MCEHYCLKWNNFPANMVSALGNLKLDEDFVDVTLACDGGKIRAHKLVLSACSDYFRDIFRSNPCQHPVVILRDASLADLECVVRYVYRGEVDVQPDRLASFLRTAEGLKIKGLANHNQASALPSPPLDSGLLDRRPLLESPIKVPVPPLLASAFTRRSHFTNLAQYLSGNNESSSGEVSTNNNESHVAKRRKTTPRRHESVGVLPNHHLHYSGSTSSLTPSPSSQPHSEDNEDTDRDSARSTESPSLISSALAAKPSLPLRASVVKSESKSPSNLEQTEEEEERPLVIEENNVVKHEVNDNSVVDLSRRSNPLSFVPKNNDELGPRLQMPVLLPHEVGVRSSVNNNNTGSNERKGVRRASSVANNLVNKDNNNSGDPMNSSGKKSVLSADNGHPRNRWRCMQPRVCQFCSKTFSNSFNLKQHQINVHLQSQFVRCNICGKMVKNKWYLRKHQVTAHGAPLKRGKPAKGNVDNKPGNKAGNKAGNKGNSEEHKMSNEEEEEVEVDNDEEEMIVVDEEGVAL